jgi:hypothetical protein
VGVEGDLLLLATSGVHEIMRVQIASLSIVMSYADSTSKCYIDRNILHSLRIESCLKFRAHKSITVSWIDKADEVDSKHSHVERDGNDDEAEYSGNEMLGKQALLLSVTFCR